jgi:hypothetical protein
MSAELLSRLKEACSYVTGPTRTGTGYVVAPGRVATAFHVVEGLAEGESCPVLLGTSQLPFQARLLKVDKSADAAILAIEGGRDIRPLPIVLGLEPRPRDRWDGFGYPALANRKDRPTGLPLSGEVRDPQSRTPAGELALLLSSDQAAAGNASPLHGFSGSPVILDDAVAGHLTEILPDPDDQRRTAYAYVYACPIERVLALLDLEPVTLGDALTTTASPFEGGHQCWGRDGELKFLFERIDNLRSITLLYGDSGIGKSTVLREFAARARRCPNTFVGTYESSAADIDPLLRALDDLLSWVYVEHDAIADIRNACLGFRNEIWMAQARRFLLAVRRTSMRGSLTAGGLGRLSVTAVDDLEWRARRHTDVAMDRVSAASAFGPEPQAETGQGGSDRAVTAAAIEMQPARSEAESDRLPKLTMEVFGAILRILQKARPNARFVFIVDNLSAPLELPGNQVQTWGSADAIHAILSQLYRKTSHLHFVFSWRLAVDTQELFPRFEVLVNQSGGISQALEHISDKDALGAWLGSELTWFSALTTDEQSSVVELAGGLPEVVVGWREAALENCDFERLVALATDTRNGIYRDLQRILTSAPLPERQMLFALGLLSRPIPAGVIGTIVGADAQYCVDTFKSWVDRGVLTRATTNAGQVYSYPHEHKREIALEHLPSTFADDGDSLVRQTFEFFLSHFSLVRPRNAKINISSPFYLQDALSLADRYGSIDGQSAHLPLLNAMLFLSGLETISDLRAPDWYFSASWPAAAQGWFLQLSLERGYGRQDLVKSELDRWLARDFVPPSTPSAAFAEAAAISRIASILDMQCAARMEACLNRTSAIRDSFPLDPDLAALQADTVVSALNLGIAGSNLAAVETALDRLRELQQRFRADTTIAASYADGIAAAISVYTTPDLLPKVDSCLSGLRQLHGRFRPEPILAVRLAKGIANAIGVRGLLNQVSDVAGLLDESRSLNDIWPGDVPLIYQRIIASSNAILGYCELEHMQEAEDLLNEMEALEGSHPALAGGSAVRAMALGKVLSVYSNRGQMREVERILAKLLRLKSARPDGEAAAPWVAEGLANTLMGYGNLADTRRAKTLLSKLGEIYREYPEGMRIAENWAAGLTSAVGGYNNSGQFGKISPLLVRLNKLLNRRPERAIASQVAWAMFIAGLAYLQADQSKEAAATRSASEELAQRFPGLKFPDNRAAEIRISPRKQD